MCGITAIIALDTIRSRDLNQEYRQRVEKETAESLERLRHRGPDSQDVWVSEDNRVALGFSRLAINDLSVAGNQPFHDASGQIHAVVNGELYMSDEDLKDLEGWHQFKGHSDCEVVIPLYLKYGTQFLSRLRGEFSLVLYDARKQHVIMARDRYGINPLFWTVVDGRLLISSEAKGFLPLGWKPEWDVKSLMDDGWRYGERTLFKGVFKPRPGNYLTCISYSPHLETQEYWDLEYPEKKVADTRSEEDMIKGVRERFVDAVRRRLKADVPVGIYLSGGLDSSAVAGVAVAVLEEECKKTGRDLAEAKKLLKCFSCGFDKGTPYDESEIARRTAEHLGLDFEMIRMDDELNAKGFADTTYYCEHHMQDLGFIGKFWLSDLTSKAGYKTILTGEGSDEHFGGYTMFYPDAIREPDGQWPEGKESNSLDEEKRKAAVWKAEEDQRRLFKLTGLDRLKLTTRDDLSGCGPAGVDGDGDRDTRARWRRNLNNISVPTHNIPMTIADFAAWTEQAYGDWDPRETAAGCPGARNLDLANDKWHPFNTSAYVWAKSVLPNTLLTAYGDRTEMAHSVEGRQPFLDHHLTEYVNAIPTSLKIRFDPDSGQFNEKWILKEAMRPYITDELYNRKKFSFMSPSAVIPGGALNKLLLELVTKDNIEQLGFLDWPVVEARLKKALDDKEHFSQRYIYTVAQWVVLSQKFGIARAEPL